LQRTVTQSWRLVRANADGSSSAQTKIVEMSANVMILIRLVHAADC
jgi:hypothetical protein